MSLIAVDRAIGQQVDGELGVLADLGFVRVFQQRLERLEHGVAVQLLRHAHVRVGQRNVGGFVGLNGEGQADQLRTLGIGAVALGDEGKQRRGLQLLQPRIELALFKNDFISRFPVLNSRLFDGQLLAGTFGVALQVFDPALEFQLGVQLHQRVAVGLAAMQLIQLDVQRYVDLDGRQFVRQKGHLTMFFEFGGQGLGATDRQGSDLVEVLVKLLDATADADQQADCGLLANAGHAGNVIDLVAHQSQVIDDVLRTDAEFLFHARHIQHAAGHGVDQGDVAVDQLRHVLVAGGDHHWTIGCRAAACQRADHVIGFDAFDAQKRVAHTFDAGMQQVDLHTQIIRHARPVGFVIVIQRITERPALGVEHHGERAVRILAPQAFEHVEHALDGTGRQSFGGGQWWQCVEGAVEVRGTVYQDEWRLGHEQNQPFRRGRR